MVVKGFSLREDGTRVSCNYGSHKERAWCECTELLDHKLYSEAYNKMEELHKLNGGFVKKSNYMLVCKVEAGYLNDKKNKTNFKNAVGLILGWYLYLLTSVAM